MKWAKGKAAQGLGVIAVATLMIFAGLSPAGAGVTVYHGIERALDAPGEISAEDWLNQSGVEVEPTSDIGGGLNVTAIEDGDWTEYSANFGGDPGESFTYRIAARVASATNGGTINMTVDGVHVGSIEVPRTGGRQNWITVHATAEVDSGEGLLRLTYNGDEGALLNLNWLEIKFDGLPFESSRLEVESWQAQSGVKEEPTSDFGGGRNLGSLHDGDWAEYSIEVDNSPDVSATYDIEARVASNKNGGTINMTVDGVHVGSIEVPGTGGWQNWTTVRSTVVLDHSFRATLRLTFNGGDGALFNVNWVRFVDQYEQPIRERAVDQMVEALESYGAEHGTYRVADSGSVGRGFGYGFYQGGVNYPKSIANVLIETGHLPSNPLHDELWSAQNSITGDVFVYPCADRVAVFTREYSAKPSEQDRNWWYRTGCGRYPIDTLGAEYFAVSAPLTSPEAETRREAAVDRFVTALEFYGADNGTYRVAGGGSDGGGVGYGFYEGTEIYPKSIANVLIESGYMPSIPQRDELWTKPTSIIGDVYVYRCADRVAVFTLEGNGKPSEQDQDWWDANGCSRRAFDQLGAKYFALSARL